VSALSDVTSVWLVLWQLFIARRPKRLLETWRLFVTRRLIKVLRYCWSYYYYYYLITYLLTHFSLCSIYCWTRQFLDLLQVTPLSLEFWKLLPY